MRLLALFLACTTPLLAVPSVELFFYWQWYHKGSQIFQAEPGQPKDQLGVFPRIARELEERGVAIQSWDLDAHRSELLTWSGVHSWSDFCHWCFPKRPPMGETTWVFWSLGPHLKHASFKHIPKERLVLYLWEPPTVEDWSYLPQVQEQFGKIYTWDDDLVDNVKFFKFYYPQLCPRIPELVPFEDKKFCVMVATRLCSKHPRQLYSEREKVIRFFEDKPAGMFDLFGRNWEKRRFKAWRGPTPDKLGTIKQYKFSICYENMRDVKGYVTEKIFDCLAAGTVPVYWGASNIADFVPPQCFIDRRQFGSDASLYEFLNSMSKTDYEQYLEAAERFLKSERAKLFSWENLIQTFVNAVAQSR